MMAEALPKPTILVNALMRRDYSIAGGAVSLAIFDARVEVWSAGRFPAGITPESLTRAHPSVQRNPIIAEVFHRAGLIEKWGRETNRVAEMCRATGIAPPEFAEISGAAVVVFRVDVLGSAGAYPQVAPQVTLHVAPQVAAILKAATQRLQAPSSYSGPLGSKTGFISFASTCNRHSRRGGSSAQFPISHGVEINAIGPLSQVVGLPMALAPRKMTKHDRAFSSDRRAAGPHHGECGGCGTQGSWSIREW